MFKKSLLSLALASLCGTAAAADVQVFGFFDQGVAFLNEHLAVGMGGPNAAKQQTFKPGQTQLQLADLKNSFTQGTGNVNTFGFKASEQINDDLTVAIHLEQGFFSDSGEEYIKGIGFERESSIALNSKSYGQLKLGRMPALTTGSGTTGIFNSRVNPFGAGYGNMTGGWKFVGTLASARHNNMINYISPTVNGVTIHAQHSFGDTKGDALEGSTDVNRFSAIGMTVKDENYFIAAAVDWLKMGQKTGGVTDDSYKAIVGGHYNFGDIKAYASAQYMKNVQYIGGYSTKEFAVMQDGQTKTKGFDGWALATGFDTNVGKGKAMFSVGYGQGENQNLENDNEYKRVNVGIGYRYPMSKQTSLYAVSGYFWEDADYIEDNIYASEVIIGLMHRF